MEQQNHNYLLIGKRIIKYDTSNPNYKETPKPKVEVSGNVKDDDSDMYGENVYKVPMEQNGNLKLEEMMSKMMGKIDKFGNRVDGGGSQAVKSEEIKGKVNNKLDKLKALRNRRK